MRKQFLYLFLALVVVQTIDAQTRGTKLGYIDMEYILQNVPDYTEAKAQLEQKVEKWKLEIDTKKIEINKLKEALKAERALLTKELIDERETEINFLENENLEYQQKRFGANGDLMIQKSVLVKPIQDQVFTAVQDIAERLKYDFIFDKTSDLTMLFAAKRFDISDQILRVLNRTEKREQLTKKQLKEEEAKENKEDALDENPALAERQKLLDDKKATRDQTLADRKLLQEQKKKEFDDKRKQIQADREAKKNGTVSANVKIDTTETAVSNDPDKDSAKQAVEEAKQKQAAAKAKTLEDRKKVLEDRKKALDEKRKKILEDREAIRKAKEEKLKENTNKN
ncbi:OmpH family outer membrane protein [Flavobacterium sp. ZB4P13]|uniref:OmpH family outer membrane protein n=1 Tax=Flavobacterium sp. ZB4P13 TaxID=3401728 RepID=UPI003AB0F004